MSMKYHKDRHPYNCPYGSDMFMPMVRLAEAWVPYQQYRCFFPLPEGWDKGTIFAELYQPYKRSRY